MIKVIAILMLFVSTTSHAQVPPQEPASSEIMKSVLLSPTLSYYFTADFFTDKNHVRNEMRAARSDAYEFISNGEKTQLLTETIESMREEYPELRLQTDEEVSAVIYIYSMR